MFLAFDDMRDAANAIEDVAHVNPACVICYIPQTEYACGTKAVESHGIQEPTSFYDGQVILLAKYGFGEDHEAQGLYEYVKGTATQFGAIVGVNEKIISGNVRHYHIEFFKISDAKFMADSVTESEQPGRFEVTSSRSLLPCASMLTIARAGSSQLWRYQWTAHRRHSMPS